MRRGVGQIYAMAIMLALMISTLMVGLGMEGSVVQTVQGNIKSIESNQQKGLEKLAVTQDGTSLSVQNVGSVPVTISYIHSNSSDLVVGQAVQPGATWTGQAIGSSPNFVITSQGNVFLADPNSSQPVQTYPSGTALIYSPLTPGSYFILDPLYSSEVGAVTKVDISGADDWTTVYPPDLPGTATSFYTGILPSANQNYTMLYTQYYYSGYDASITPFLLQAPQAAKVALSSIGPISFESGSLGFLATVARYQTGFGSDYFWNTYAQVSATGAALPTFDPGAFPSRSQERFFGNAVEVSNGTAVAEFGFGTSYAYETTGSFPSNNFYPYSSMFIRVIRWGSSGLSTSALYNVSANYPAYPYLADDAQGWSNGSCIYGNLLAVRVPMRSSTNSYVLLDVYNLDSGRLVARKLLFNGTYVSDQTPALDFNEGFLDSDHLVLEDGLRGTVQILSISGNLSVQATAPSLPSAAKVGGAVPLMPEDYTTITDFYLIPGTGLVYPTYAGAYFYGYGFNLYKTIPFDGFEPQPISPHPLILVSNTTMIALVASPDGGSYVKVFGP